MVLITKKQNYKISGVALVSVPLRGLWFLSINSGLRISDIVNRFPSPYGDYGSYPAEREKKIAWYEN